MQAQPSNGFFPGFKLSLAAKAVKAKDENANNGEKFIELAELAEMKITVL